MNPLQTTYDEKVKTQRLEAESGSDIEGYEDYILSVSCCIQQLDDSPNQDPDGGFGINYLMFCDDEDIKEGDNVVRDEENYRVIGVKRYSFYGHTHKEIIIRKYG
jgi:hypothetical protein